MQPSNEGTIKLCQRLAAGKNVIVGATDECLSFSQKVICEFFFSFWMFCRNFRFKVWRNVMFCGITVVDKVLGIKCAGFGCQMNNKCSNCILYIQPTCSTVISSGSILRTWLPERHSIDGLVRSGQPAMFLPCSIRLRYRFAYIPHLTPYAFLYKNRRRIGFSC